jgi:peptidyl-prolyl cis-trans isomerase C
MTKIKKQILKGLKAPVIQFMIIGAIFFLFDTYILSADYNENSLENSVSLSVGEVKSMEQFWISKWQRPPTDIEMEGMINQKVEEAILFKEATKLGLDKNDDIIRQRMAQKLQFLTNNLAKPDSIDDEELEIYFNNIMLPKKSVKKL